MEKKFNEEAYRNGSEVVCDVCGSVIEHINVKTRVIARQAEGFNVTVFYLSGMRKEIHSADCRP